jgi:hypothetical protein
MKIRWPTPGDGTNVNLGKWPGGNNYWRFVDGVLQVDSYGDGRNIRTWRKFQGVGITLEDSLDYPPYREWSEWMTSRASDFGWAEKPKPITPEEVASLRSIVLAVSQCKSVEDARKCVLTSS